MTYLCNIPDWCIIQYHSLGSAAVNKINDEHSNAVEGKGQTRPKKVRFQKQNDIVSALGGHAETQDVNEWNLVVAHTYKLFEGQGLYNINPDSGTNISQGIL